MTNTKKSLLALGALAISFSLGYFATPNKIETKEVIKTVVQKEEAKTKIVYREKIVYADGTSKETETEREDTNTKESSSSSKSSEMSKTKDAGLVLAALAIYDTKDVGKDPEYAITASKRVIGAINITGIVTSDRKVGLGLGWSF
jgi:hypothetical protein